MGSEQALALIEQAKELHSYASTRKGLRSHPNISRSELESMYRPGQNISGPVQTIIRNVYPPCTAPLASLKPMRIEDLRLEHRHRGRLLVVRAFGTPMRDQAVQNAVEDGEGGVDRLCVCNIDRSIDAARVLGKGIIYAIKEPYYEVVGDRRSTIRVDHPSDLLRLRPDDPIVPQSLRPHVTEAPSPTATALKTQGNAAYKVKNFHDALDHYSHALQVCADSQSELAADLHRNRALVNLNLGRYEAAFADADAAVVDSDPVATTLATHNAKAYYRRGCAAYHLMEFNQAKVDFENVLQIVPNDTAAERELYRTEQRLLESTGQYDFEAMSASVNGQQRRLDHANYTSSVEVRPTADRGRGLFATRDIKAGDVVICEKAFDVAFDDEEVGELSFTVDLPGKAIQGGTHASRLSRAIQKLLHSPKQAKRLLDLHDAGYEPKEDLAIVEGGVVALDVFRVHAILKRNGFGLEHGGNAGGSTGLWIIVSYMNHSCVGNVNRAFLGDMMAVRACKDIKQGEEITMRYQDPDDSGIYAFQASLQRAWGFECNCMLCQAEGKVHPTQQHRRRELMHEMRAFINAPANQLSGENPPLPGAVVEAEILYAKLVQTYDNALFKQLPRIGLHQMSQWLCTAYWMRKPDKCLDMALQLLRNIGIMVTISKPQQQKVSINRTHGRPDLAAVQAVMYASAMLKHQGRKNAAAQMREYGEELYKTEHGSLYGLDKKFPVL